MTNHSLLVTLACAKNSLALIDGTLGGADALFEMLRLYLPLFNALQPSRVLLIADGAP